jgi:hypothetical protein
MGVTGGLTWFGTQCSSFSAMCRFNSERNANNCYLGNMTRQFVDDGNVQMTITALLFMLSHLLGNIA